jgi:hypothetical protein
MRLRYASLTEKKNYGLEKEKRAIKLNRWTNSVAVKHKNVENMSKKSTRKNVEKVRPWVVPVLGFCAICRWYRLPAYR